MLKKQIKNKKGFTLIEILVAVSILGIIVGPLLMSLFSNNRVIEQARKETEATYVAKKVMEETLADYYSSISGNIADDIDGMGFPVYIGKLVALLGKNSSGREKYTSDETFKSRYADNFKYEVRIVPSGKNGLGVSDSSANYIHIYSDKVNSMDKVYAVFPDGVLKLISPKSNSENALVVSYSNSSCGLSLNDSPVYSGAALSESNEVFRIVCYSSKDSTAFQYKFGKATWPSKYDKYLINYTSRADATQVKVSADSSFVKESNIETYYSSEREQWDIALYEITVSVYEGDSTKALSSVESVIEAKIFY